MGLIRPHRIRLAISKYPRFPQRRTIAAFRNTNPGEKSSNDALGLVGPPKHRGRANDGTVPWQKLSSGEKVIRSVQQSFNFTVILAGLAVTGLVGSALWYAVLSPNSSTTQFNKAVTRIRGDRAVVDALCGPMGKGGDIRAFGEAGWSRWQRNRPIANKVEVDRTGVEHMRMHFHVEGTKAKGVVRVHLVRGKGEGEWQYHLLAVEVPGMQRIVLEDRSKSGIDKKDGKLFGVKWW